MAGFWRMLRGRRGLLAFGLTTVTISTLLGLVIPASTKVVIDYVLTDNPGPSGIPDWIPVSDDRRTLLWQVAGAMLVLAIVAAAINVTGRWQVTRLARTMVAKLRRKAFEHAVRLPLDKVHAMKSGGVASVLREDAGGAAEMTFSVIYNPWRALVQLTGTLLVLVVVDWRLLVGALALGPVIWLTHRTWINRIRPVWRDIRRTREALDASATESFGGMRVVRGFGREHGEASAFVHTNDFMIRQELLAWWRSRGVEVAWQVLIPAASAGVILYGGLQVLEGSLTIGDVMMFSAYLMMLLGPLETLASTATQAQNNLAGFDRLLDLLEEPLEFDGSRDGVVLQREQVAGRVTMEGVHFRYPGGNTDVLEDINLDVSPGEVIALVGLSGAGKTTLCNLVARFYDASEGVIRLDGRDLREVDVSSYRRLLGIVEQDVFLFDGSVADNIGYARRDATREDIERAAAVANAAGFIERLEQGYDTLIGERGVRLSGGQKQRIAIARAVLADPRILILDEATSNLDSESEALIQRSLAELMRGRTSFVIAHRLSTIRRADRIVVIEDGRIIEVGSDAELTALGGRYAELLRMQLETTDETPVGAETE
jgi:ATP-binding cassette subfamily B protein/subfamily B ATP-binding cassette protein MsbA